MSKLYLKKTGFAWLMRNILGLTIASHSNNTKKKGTLAWSPGQAPKLLTLR
jgi:hypothetical protein